jgi:hypothetical protein
MNTIKRVSASNFKSGFPRKRSRIVNIIVADNTSILISINTILRLREGGCEPERDKTEKIKNRDAEI